MGHPKWQVATGNSSEAVDKLKLASGKSNRAGLLLFSSVIPAKYKMCVEQEPNLFSVERTGCDFTHGDFYHI